MLNFSKVKEAIICLKAGKVTLPYPVVPAPAGPGFRGRPVFDPNKCIGCGGCANNCPAREILLSDVCQEIRILRYSGQRCSYCGRCADLCPEKAITMSAEFETATDKISDLRQEIEVFMGTCQRCGRCFKNENPLNDLILKGYRADDLEGNRWLCTSRSFLGEGEFGDLKIELD